MFVGGVNSLDESDESADEILHRSNVGRASVSSVTTEELDQRSVLACSYAVCALWDGHYHCSDRRS